MRTAQEKKNMKYVMQIRTILITFLFAFCVGIFMPNNSHTYKIANIIWIIIFVFIYSIYNPIYSNNYSIYIKDDMLFLQSGVFIITKKQISVSNIQYFKQSQGIIQRFFSQYSVIVYTAGATIYISGLSLDNALKLQKKISIGNEVQNFE